jgi:hypothetical protein
MFGKTSVLQTIRVFSDLNYQELRKHRSVKTFERAEEMYKFLPLAFCSFWLWTPYYLLKRRLGVPPETVCMWWQR